MKKVKRYGYIIAMNDMSWFIHTDNDGDICLVGECNKADILYTEEEARTLFNRVNSIKSFNGKISIIKTEISITFKEVL